MFWLVPGKVNAYMCIVVKYEFNKRVILALTTKKLKAKGTIQLWVKAATPSSWKVIKIKGTWFSNNSKDECGLIVCQGTSFTC